MAKRPTFTGTFSNGVQVKRTSDRREYTHAWIGVGIYNNRARPEYRGETGSSSGFSTSREQAARNMATECRFLDLTFSEIVETVKS